MHQPDLWFTRKQVLIRWYWCAPDAKPLGYDTIYASSDWLSQLENCPTELGEIPRYTKTRESGRFVSNMREPVWSRGDPPLGATGQAPCGPRELWNGPLNGAPGLKRGPGGLPICCNAALGAAMGMGVFPYPTPTPTPARGAMVMAGLEFPEETRAPLVMTGADVAYDGMAATGADVAVGPLAKGIEASGAYAPAGMVAADVAYDGMVESGPPVITSAIGTGELVAAVPQLDGEDGQYGEQGASSLTAAAASLNGAAQSGVQAAAGLVAGHAAVAGSGQDGSEGAAALVDRHAVLSATGQVGDVGTAAMATRHAVLSASGQSGDQGPAALAAVHGKLAAAGSFTAGGGHWLDNFTDTTGTLLTAHTPDVGSGGYSTMQGAAKISGNTCVESSLGSVGDYNSDRMAWTKFSVGALAATGSMKFKLSGASGTWAAKLLIRFDGVGTGATSNAFLCRLTSNGTMLVYKVASGALTFLGVTSWTFTAGTTYTLLVTDTGSVMTFQVSGFSGSLQTITDSSFNTNTHFAIGLGNSNNVIDTSNLTQIKIN